MRNESGHPPTDVDFKAPIDSDQNSNVEQPSEEYEVTDLIEVTQTPPPIPDAARLRGVHAESNNFDDAKFGNRAEPKNLNPLNSESLRRIREEETETQIVRAVDSHNLPPELKVQILNSREMSGILDYLGQVPSKKEAAAIVNQVVTELAGKQRQKLEALGLRFHPDNTLVMDEAAADAQSYDNVRRGLENLHWLTEAAQVDLYPVATKKGRLERVQPAAETITDHVYTDLLNLGIDAGTVQNALSHDLLDELEHTNYMTGKTNVILDAIDKVVRKLENKGQFTLDLYGDPQPIGALNWLKNKLSFGRRADKQKSSREYQDIVALQTLRDAVAVGTSGAPIKYPAPESFADMAAATAPVKTRKPVSQSRRWAAGIAGITAAGTAASMYDDVQARDTREAAKVSVAEPAAEAAQPEAQDGEYQFPQFTIAPQRSEEGTSRTRRSADFTPARSAEAEVVSKDSSIERA